ncbi:hypothetical protein pEaSNUABM49_00401 [Erwinia phage pEa_SNUABM_49]|nr:hypothetical protein pEaSNUABM49_00401 [Erwinia phage pEa_SNUABM_49]
MHKHAKNLSVNDMVKVAKDEYLKVIKIEYFEYSVRIQGFINYGTDCEQRSFGYCDVVFLKADEKPSSLFSRIIKYFT